MTVVDDVAIVAARGPKESLDPRRPYAVTVEKERTRDGRIEDVATVFLTNKECPYKCLMCDLWRYTLDASLSSGDVLAQLDHVQERLAGVRHIKLYNAGNFFDAKAILRSDRPAIARRLRKFDTVIIENHPSLVNAEVPQFADRLAGRLEVAMGLETVHPDVLPRLNKRMTARDFESATRRLVVHGIDVRTFVLLAPPFLPVSQAPEWAVRSVEFAFQAGADVCTVIPTRGGNGIMERLAEAGDFSPPSLGDLEQAQEECLSLTSGGQRLFVDLWDVERLQACPNCRMARVERMARMNLSQVVEPAIRCADCP